MAIDKEKFDKSRENKTEGILSRIVKRTVEGMRTGLNVEKNKGILATLAERASSPTGQFYATLADPNAYYDKQGFGSAGTGMRAATGARQAAIKGEADVGLTKAKSAASGYATPTARLNAARAVWSKYMGDGYGSIDVADPNNPGKVMPFSALSKQQQWDLVNQTVDGLAQGGNLQENMVRFGEKVDRIRKGGKDAAPRTAKQIKDDRGIWAQGIKNWVDYWGPIGKKGMENIDRYYSKAIIGKPVEPIITPEQVEDIGSRFGRHFKEGTGLLQGWGKKASSLIPR